MFVNLDLQTISLEFEGKDGGRMRNPDKIRRFLITSFIVVLTIGTPFISSVLLVNGLPGKEDPSITSNSDFTNNYSTNPPYELKKAPNLDDFFDDYNDGYLQPESYLPEEVSQLEQETSYYDYDENLAANIDLSKVAYKEGEIVEYSVQVTSKLDQKANYPIRILVTNGSSFYYWYYNLKDYSVIQDIYVQTNTEGFYYGSFIPPEEGTYTIMVIPNYSTYPIARRSVTISDLSVFWRVPFNAVRHASTQSYALVLNTSDFSPLVDANVTLTMENYVNYNYDYNYSSELLYSGVTNAEGLMLMDYSIDTSGNGYSSLVLSVEYNESEAELTQFIWFNDYYYFSENTYQNYNFITTTDKPIYQPGEMVRTRTMVFIDDYWKVNKEPAVSTEVEVEFKTLNGFTLFHKTLTTDEFGIIEWDYQFDVDTKLGTYTLTFRKDSSQESIGIEVDQYEKPDFRVNIELESDYVPPKKDIVGKIIAEYYFGKPVPGSVKITFLYYDIVLDEIEGTLDSNGEFSFTWRVPRTNPYDNEEIEALYLSVEVTDPIGRTVYAEKDVTCLSNIWAYLWTWPYGVFDKGEEIRASFSAYQVSVRNDYYWYSWSYVSNAEVTITVFGLGSLNRKIKLFSLESSTNEFGSGSVMFIIPEEYCDDFDEFVLDLEVRTSDGRTGEDSRAIALAIIHTTIELNPNTTINPGDDVELTISVVNTETNSLVDAEISVYIMDSEYDTLYYTWDYYLDGSETFTIKLSDFAPSGNYYINTYCRTENRLFGGYYPSYSSTYTQFVVGESNSLTIETDKDTYLSSEEIVLTAHLGSANNVPTIFELTKRGIVDIITVDKSQTDFILNIEDINDLGPRLTIFAFTVTPNGLILEAFVVVEIIKDLNVEIESDKEIYEPGETAIITIKVTNENDEPLDALGVFSLVDSSIFAVKEDILSEESYFEESRYWAQISTSASWTSPMSFWWYWWMIDASSSYYPYAPFYREGSYDNLFLATPGGVQIPQVEGEIRDNLPESANWLPRLEIINGEVVVEAQLPDNIGEWTIRVFVTADGHGVIEKETFKTFLPFFVDLKTPLGIVQDNVIVVRGIVYNYLSDVCTASLTLDASGLTILNNPTQTVIIPKDYLVEVRWSVYCDNFGSYNITLTGLTNVKGANWFDGIRKSINIQPNGVILETVMSGFVNNSKVIEYEIFDESVYENIDLVVSPGIMDVAITSWERLIGYPYGCIEQTMSKIFPDVMIYHYLNQTGQLTSVIANQLESMLQVGLSKIASNQHYDGGWGWWSDDQSQTYMTAVVLYGLGLMKDLGYQLSDERLLLGGFFLINNQLPSGAFSTDGWRIDDLSFTAYVIRSILTNNFTDFVIDDSLAEAINYFKSSWIGGSSLKNPYAAALFIEATYGTSYEDTGFLNDLADYILLEAIVEDEGIRWDITIDDHWRALGGTIETTATVITALTKMNFMLHFVTIRNALSWILTQQNYWGWGNTADTSAAIKAIVTVASSSSDPIDCIIDITIDGWTTQFVFNESESEFLSAELLQLEEYLSVGNNSIIINQTGTGQIYYYFAAKQILRSDLEITITNPIYTSPGEEFSVEVNLQHNSDVVYPVNIRIDSLEDDLTLVGDQNQTLQILLDSEIVIFHFIAPDAPGEYHVGGFSVSYLFADSQLENFSPGIVMKTLTEVPVIVEESFVSLSKSNTVNSYYYQPFSDDLITQANDYDIYISREYSNEIDLSRGETIVVTLVINNQWEDKEFVMIEESIPAGFIIDESSLQTGALIIDFSISAGKLALFIGELEEGITEISYRLIVFDVGSSIAFPTQLSSMYDSWIVKSAPSILGSLMVNIDPSTGTVTTDSLRPILVKKMAFLKNRESYFDVSLTLQAFDNDEIYNVQVLFSGGIENWRTKDAIVTHTYDNGSKDFQIDLGAFADEEIKYLIAIEDRSGNIFFTEINTIIVPAVTAAFIFIFIAIIISTAFAFATSSATRQLKPKTKTSKLISDATKTTYKDTKEDLTAYKNLPEYRNGE